MENDEHPAPLQFKGVMVSSTFTDLKDHRAAIIKAIDRQGLKAVVMENDGPKPGVDVIDSSLQMVRDSSAYVALISHKYGQIPKSPERNPKRLSLTELEFDEAQRIKRPVLLFIMGDDHDVKPGDVERDPEKMKKLDAFREKAKRLRPDSAVHRVYKVFNDLHEFEVAATQAVAELRRYLDEQARASEITEPPQVIARPGADRGDPIPAPPAFYAEPAYIGSHRFIGRKAQLETLNDWASPAESHPILLFEAIGGAGKSMLTWEWTTNYVMNIRSDWAGRFWYSFYEKGAIMADFCRRALAYITGQPLKSFYKKKTVELGEQLLHHLRTRPWLLILDGLERVLVAYHRYDAAQLPDEQAGTTDEIAHRDPCSAIRPEDDDLLRALAAAAPSKILITSRLIPRVLLNSASQPIPGVLRERLPGLRPADAEELLRSCGITGTSQEIQNYLQSHCDCHPLVTGVLAGLINDYFPDRGNFDAWVDDPDGGGQLNLANLNLVQKRNHILHAALAALPEKSRQLLSILALLSESVDADTLSAFNPHLSGKQGDLAETVRDLEQRGLLQYDAQAKHYDLHPVVRGVAAGSLRQEEKEHYGQRVVDYFSQQSHNPYEEAKTVNDLRNGIQIVRTLLQMGRHQQANEAYGSDLNRALLHTLEAYDAALSLLRPFFPQGWGSLPEGVVERDAAYLVNEAACLLYSTGKFQEALDAFGTSLLANLQQENWTHMSGVLINIANTLNIQNRQARAISYWHFAINMATLNGDNEVLFRARLDLFDQLVVLGQWEEAEAIWQLLNPMGRNWTRDSYRSGSAEWVYARFRFQQGDLREEDITQAEQLAQTGRNRAIIRELHRLRGEWQLEQRQWALAADSFHEAVSMAREIGQSDARAETLLAIAKFHLDQLHDPRHEAEQLDRAEQLYLGGLAELWFLIGDTEQATQHALAAYELAWADGKPYVWRYELNKARALLDQLGVEIPDLPPYDSAKDAKLPWDDEVVAAIEKLRAEKNAEKQPKKNAKKRKKK
ncbi:MAG TPA: DUF4062 domain-containing protein [Blastocatellia bacterium]|nr:DUF4062 domain-containing protein [Blastocatellia bacterium]